MKIVAIVALSMITLAAQTPGRLPDESAGLDQIVQALIAVLDRADILALGEVHGRKADSEVRIALVRHPDFAKRVRTIVVESGNTDQAFFAAVRGVNAKLPADARLTVVTGDAGNGTINREPMAFGILKDQVLEKHGKALVIYGAAHFYRAFPAEHLQSSGADIGLVRMLDMAYPGRTFAVVPVGGPREPLPPGVSGILTPDYTKFDRVLKSPARPLLIPAQHPPFRDFTAEEFLGGDLLSCRPPNGCRSTFTGSPITLGQTADAVIYYGNN